MNYSPRIVKLTTLYAAYTIVYVLYSEGEKRSSISSNSRLKTKQSRREEWKKKKRAEVRRPRRGAIISSPD